jgi:hypothetical protein
MHGELDRVQRDRADLHLFGRARGQELAALDASEEVGS